MLSSTEPKSTADGSAVTAIDPVTIGRGGIRYAPAVTAGPWLFATGLLATDFRSGVAPEVLQTRLPHHGLPRYEREAGFLFDRLGRLLGRTGYDRSEVVRIDQFYPSWPAVDPYHRQRRAFFGAYIPPSTSILVKSLLLPDAAMDLQVIARRNGDGSAKAIASDRVQAPPESGYASIVSASDFVFLAGQLARGPNGEIPPEARVPPSHRWKGTQIVLETEYLVRQRIEPALAAGGSSLADAVKAQVYLEDVEDTAAFLQVWNRLFAGRQPATTIVPTAVPGFGTVGAGIEINLVALAGGSAMRRQDIEADVFPSFGGQPNAVRAGDLLFLSGLMAVDGDGLVAAAVADARQPYFGSGIAEQMRFILAAAEKICAAAGTSLTNAVRVQHFHTDLHDFYPAYQIWQETLGGRALPFSAVEVPGPLPVPGAGVVVDLWVYVPPKGQEHG